MLILMQKSSNFVPLAWKLHNPYCHTLQSSCITHQRMLPAMSKICSISWLIQKNYRLSTSICWPPQIKKGKGSQNGVNLILKDNPLLKVSEFQKQIFLFLFERKKTQTKLFFDVKYSLINAIKSLQFFYSTHFLVQMRTRKFPSEIY